MRHQIQVEKKYLINNNSNQIIETKTQNVEIDYQIKGSIKTNYINILT